MLDLLQKQIESSDVYYKDLFTKSNGEYQESRIDLKAKGISMVQFLGWWKGWMQDLQDPATKQHIFLDTMVPAHPEHYALPPYSEIIKPIGEHVARVRIRPSKDLPDIVRAYDDSAFLPLSATGTLDDGQHPILHLPGASRL